MYETEHGRSGVAAMTPVGAVGLVGDNPEVQVISREADERLRRALGVLERA